MNLTRSKGHVQMDTEYTTNHKKKASSARQGRRRHMWELRNRPSFGPVDHYDLQVNVVRKRTAEQIRAYLYLGTNP